MTMGENLQRLQRLDSEYDQKSQRLTEVEAKLGKDDVVRQARRALETARRLTQKSKHRQHDLELEVEGLLDRISRSEQRLYSGKVNNPKELADLQAEVTSLKRRRRKLEDDLLDAMIKREEADTAQEQAEGKLDEIESRWSTQQADLKVEREELQARLEEIEQKRAELLPSIEASVLASYRSLREQKRGQVVVNLRDGACGGCGVTLSPILEWELREGKLVYCDNCKRIIVPE